MRIAHTKKELVHKVASLKASRSDQRKVKILDHCLKQLASEGLEPLTLESVARRCGLRRSHLAYHFKTNQELVWQAIQYALSFGQEYAVNEILLATSAKHRLLAFVSANFHWFENHPTHLSAFAFLNYLSVCNKKYAAFNRTLAEMAEGRLEAILAGGPLRPTVKPQELAATARALRAYLVGEMARHFGTDRPQAMELERLSVQTEFLRLASRVWREE